MLTDQVRIWTQLDQIGVCKALTKLAHKAFLDDLLVTRLMVRDLQSALLGERTARLARKGHSGRGRVLLLLHRRRRFSKHRHILELIHHLDASSEFVSAFQSLIHRDEVLVHLVKVLIDELVDDLRREVDPYVKNSVLVLTLEGLQKVTFNI